MKTSLWLIGKFFKKVVAFSAKASLLALLLVLTGSPAAWGAVGCDLNDPDRDVARLFPELERSTREVELDIAMQSDGSIHFRAEHNNFPAADAQAGEVLRCYREHQMSKDAEFLRRVWPGAKKALQYLIDQDANGPLGVQALQPPVPEEEVEAH